MIATFIIDWPVLVLIGLVFGGLAPAQGWWRSAAFVAGLVSAGVFTLTAMLSYAIAPDWMWMYYVDPSEVSEAVPVMPPAYLFTFLLGFAAAGALSRLGRNWLWAAGAVAITFEGIIIAITWDRYRVVGTMAEWSSGRAAELFSASPSGDARTIALFGPVFAVVTAVALFVTWRKRAAVTDR